MHKNIHLYVFFHDLYLEGGSARPRHHHVAGPAVLALLPAGRARVLVLAVFADIVGGAAGKGEEGVSREKLTYVYFCG